MLDLRVGGSPCQEDYSGGSRGGAGSPPPPSPPTTTLFSDQTVARRVEKNLFWRPPPAISKGLDDRATPPPPYLKVWILHWIIQNSKLKMLIKYCDNSLFLFLELWNLQDFHEKSSTEVRDCRSYKLCC